MVVQPMNLWLAAFAMLGLMMGLPVHGAQDCGSYNFQTLTFPSANGTEIFGRLFLPTTTGSDLPRMVMVLHGTGGLFKTEANLSVPRDSLRMETEFCDWVEILVPRGYAAFFPDSFVSRGFYDWSEWHPANLTDPERLLFRTLDSFGALKKVCSQTASVDCSCRSLIGFSNGAEAAQLTQFWRLDTVPELWPFVSDVVQNPALWPYDIAVPWYGGCGLYGFVSLEGSNQAKWNDTTKPFYYSKNRMAMQLAETDPLRTPNCQPTREFQTNTVASNLGISSNVTFTVYDGVGHGFDHGSSPTAAELAARYQARNMTLSLLCSATKSASPGQSSATSTSSSLSSDSLSSTSPASSLSSVSLFEFMFC